MKNYLNYFIFLSIALLFGIRVSFAQKSNCGTTPPSQVEKSSMEKVMEPSLKIAAGSKVANGTLTCVPIKVHDVTDGFGGGGVDRDKLNQELANLNYHFGPAGIEFFFCGTINVLDDGTYYDFNDANQTNLFIDEPRATNALNLYLFNSVMRVSSGAVAGYAYYPSNSLQSTVCIMDKTTLANTDNGTIIHEFGHLFNLYHTHDGTENGNTDTDAEHVPRSGTNSNCSTASDLLCDTDADPRGTISSCVYTGGEFDIFGNPYTPPIDNIMSYYSDLCGGRFTDGQIGRIAAALNVRLGHTAYSLTCAPTTVNAPSSLTGSLVTNAIELNWTDNAANEIGYLIERSTVSSTAGFVPVLMGGVSSNITQFIDNTISSNTSYWYRVKSSNGNCNGYSNVIQIDVGLIYCVPSYYAPFMCNNATLSNVTLTGMTTINNTTVCVSPAYTDYSSTHSAEVIAGTTYNFSVTKSLTGYTRYIHVYVDYNQDGDFDEVDEKILADGIAVPNVTYNGSFTIPLTAYNGTTKIRFLLANTSTAAPCVQSVSYGETEDYSLVIFGGVDKPVPTALNPIQTVTGRAQWYPNPATNTLNLNYSSQQSGEAIYILMDVTGQEIVRENFTVRQGDNTREIGIQNLTPGVYFVQLRMGDEINTMKLFKK